MAQTQANLDNEINVFLPSGSDITAAQLRQVLHDMNSAVFQSGITGFAAPANLVGLTPAAGVLATAMQSDATLAISQAIAPTWTAPHIFGNLTASVSPLTGAVTVAGGVGIAGALNVGSTLNSTGSIYVNAAPVSAAQRAIGTVSGTVSTTDITFSIPSGATVLEVTTYTNTQFLATGTVSLTAGSAAGDNTYIAAQSITAIGVQEINMNGSNAAGLRALPLASPNFFIRLTQTGTPSGVGQATIVVQYLVT